MSVVLASGICRNRTANSQLPAKKWFTGEQHSGIVANSPVERRTGWVLVPCKLISRYSACVLCAMLAPSAGPQQMQDGCSCTVHSNTACTGPGGCLLLAFPSRPTTEVISGNPSTLFSRPKTVLAVLAAGPQQILVQDSVVLCRTGRGTHAMPMRGIDLFK